MQADLTGYQEVPAISTVAKGTFDAWIDTEAGEIFWKLKYDGLEGAVQQAHVHFGQMSVNGGVSFFLCSNLGNGPVGTQTCPEGPAVLEGVITADWWSGPVLPVSSRAHWLKSWPPSGTGRPMRTSTRTKWPGGEIRGQLH